MFWLKSQLLGDPSGDPEAPLQVQRPTRVGCVEVWLQPAIPETLGTVLSLHPPNLPSPGTLAAWLPLLSGLPPAGDILRLRVQLCSGEAAVCEPQGSRLPAQPLLGFHHPGPPHLHPRLLQSEARHHGLHQRGESPHPAYERKGLPGDPSWVCGFENEDSLKLPYELDSDCDRL